MQASYTDKTLLPQHQPFLLYKHNNENIKVHKKLILLIQNNKKHKLHHINLHLNRHIHRNPQANTRDGFRKPQNSPAKGQVGYMNHKTLFNSAKNRSFSNVIHHGISIDPFFPMSFVTFLSPPLLRGPQTIPYSFFKGASSL